MMKHTMTALLNGPLRAQADDVTSDAGAAAGKEGLMAGLDAFMDNPSGDKPTPTADTDPAPKSEDAPVAATQELDLAPKDVVETVDDDDLGLPSIGKPTAEPEVVKPTFDAEAYDTETAALIASIEKAGHPGDAFKELRAKLKGYESMQAESPALQARIDELQAKSDELAEKAAMVEAMQEKVTSITSQNAELLLQENADYQAKVAKPHNEIRETVKALSEAKGISEDDLWKVIGENDPVKRMTAVDELEEKIGGRHALMVDTIARDIRVISALDKEMKADAQSIVAAAKERESGNSAEALAASTKSYQTFAKSSFEQYASKVPGFTDDTGQMTDTARSSLAKSQVVDINTLKPNDLGYMAFTVQALPQTLKHVKALESQIRDLRVAAGEKVGNVSGGTATSKTGLAEESDKPRGMLDDFLAKDFRSAV